MEVQSSEPTSRSTSATRRMRERPSRCRGVRSFGLQTGHATHGTKRSASLGDISGLRSLLPLDDLELDLVALGQRLESVSLDGAEVHEDVGAALTRDETEALRVVEPLHCSVDACHVPYL